MYMCTCILQAFEKTVPLNWDNNYTTRIQWKTTIYKGKSIYTTVYKGKSINIIRERGVKTKMSQVMRKPVYAICKQKRHRSDCTSSLISTFVVRCLDSIISRFYIQNFKTLASFCSWTGRFESYLVANPKARFSRDEAQMTACNNSLTSILPLPRDHRQYSSILLYRMFQRMFCPSIFKCCPHIRYTLNSRLNSRLDRLDSRFHASLNCL